MAMSLTDWWAEMAADREARTRHERHGSGEITFLDEVPTHATGCRLPDGSVTDAVCLTQQAAMSDEVPRVWTRCLPGTSLRRRGRLTLQSGAEPLFVDEVDADLDAPVTAVADLADLERDLLRSDRVRGLVRSEIVRDAALQRPVQHPVAAQRGWHGLALQLASRRQRRRHPAR